MRERYHEFWRGHNDLFGIIIKLEGREIGIEVELGKCGREVRNGDFVVRSDGIALKDIPAKCRVV